MSTSDGAGECPSPQGWGASLLPPALAGLLGRVQSTASAVAAVLAAGALFALWWWRAEVRKRLRKVRDEVHPLAMRRVKWVNASKGSAAARRAAAFGAELDLTPSFQAYLDRRAAEAKKGKDDRGGTDDAGRPFRVTSLSSYLSSLEPANPLSSAREEIDAVLGGALLKFLGPRIGPALLPALGALPADAILSIAGLTAEGEEKAHEEKHHVGHVAAGAPAIVPKTLGGLSMLSMAGTGDMWYQAQRRMGVGVPTKLGTAIGLAYQGDIGSPPFPQDSIPNPFVVSEHWSAAVEAVEAALKKAAEDAGRTYDPDERPPNTAAPTGDVLLPDLHMGTGGVRSTHTNRQIAQNRVISVLLNRLGTLDVLDEREAEGGSKPEPFVVKMVAEGEALTRPCQLLEALLKAGHKAEASVAIRTTSFGLAMCVRTEEDEEEGDDAPRAWRHIPVGLLLRSGLQSHDGDSIPYFLTHSSIDLTLSGPLFGGGPALIQFFHNIMGTAGWESGHYPDTPWQLDGRYVPFPESDVVDVVRTAGLVACCINSTADRLSLPLGGYGWMGVCNDSAAMVEKTVMGKTSIYPCMAMGGYQRHVVRKAGEIAARLEGEGAPEGRGSAVTRAALRLAETMKAMPSDIHHVPATMPDAARRMLLSLPEHPPFQKMVVAREMLLEEFGDLADLEKSAAAEAHLSQQGLKVSSVTAV